MGSSPNWGPYLRPFIIRDEANGTSKVLYLGFGKYLDWVTLGLQLPK